MSLAAGGLRCKGSDPIVKGRFLVGNGGVDYGDYYWGLCRDYYNRDPFPAFPTKRRVRASATTL